MCGSKIVFIYVIKLLCFNIVETVYLTSEIMTSDMLNDKFVCTHLVIA